MTRSPAMQAFLDRCAEALQTATKDEAARAATAVRQRWDAMTGQAGGSAPAQLPVCKWIEPALTSAAGGPRAPLAAAFKAIADDLTWRRRSSADPRDTAFWDGHANAMILGPGGLEERSDLWLGATVMAPGVTYADHDHPPEEVYLSLAPGEWWNAEMDWTDPGPHGAIYNPPGIRHRMRAGEGPFLALWFLPT